MIRAIRKALVAFWKWWEREAMKGPRRALGLPEKDAPDHR